MDKHTPKEEMIKDLENILAKINALEVTAKDEEAKANVKILRKLTEGQIPVSYTHLTLPTKA